MNEKVNNDEHSKIYPNQQSGVQSAARSPHRTWFTDDSMARRPIRARPWQQRSPAAVFTCLAKADRNRDRITLLKEESRYRRATTS
jgi:hypothetical protein